MSVYKPPTAEEIATLDPAERAVMAAAFLESLEPGRQPLVLFKQLTRLTVGSAVEVVPIRTVKKQPEIWLGKRSENDPWWPNKWALPGVVILPSDTHDSQNTLLGPVARLFESELRGIRQIDDLHQLPSQFRFDDRGNEVTTQYWTHVETDDEQYNGRFFTLDDVRDAELDGSLLTEGLITIDRAIADYQTRRTQA
jgi:hypothetical protein